MNRRFSLFALLILFNLLFINAGINLQQLDNYAAQSVPNYIIQDNTPPFNMLTDKGAVLGRVLFYDKQLSINNSIACASCHKQEFAFGDTAALSIGHDGGTTGRHSMRLVNNRFSQELRFFWDERANSLEQQSTQPIRDHVEMGFSGNLGNPGFDSLIRKLNSLSYYPILFKHAFGDSIISESRIQQALAQFIRSIQSFDSKYDIGRAQVLNDAAPFPNFNGTENAGKTIFLNPPNQPGGAGCQGCHRAPEFDIAPNTLNNGVIGVAGMPGQIDLTNTKSPTLRDLFNSAGQLNGPLMHNAQFKTIEQVIEHYNAIPNNPLNTNLDQRLRGPGGVPQQLNLNPNQKAALIAFLKTLSGNALYTDPKWSNPFETDGTLNLTGVMGFHSLQQRVQVSAFPNPNKGTFKVYSEQAIAQIRTYSSTGQLIGIQRIDGNNEADIIIEHGVGHYFLDIQLQNGQSIKKKIVVY